MRFLGFNSFAGSFQALSWSQLTPQEIPLLTCAVLLFGLMGLKLPVTKIGKKIYTFLEVALLCVAVYLLDWDIQIIIPLLLVIMLRSCIIFGSSERWIVLGITGVVYMLSQLPMYLLLFFALSFIQPNWLSNTLQNHVPDYLTILPNGGVKVNINAEFTSEQVKTFISGLQSLTIQSLISNTILFGLTLTFVLLLVNALVSERQGRRKLALAHEQLYQYSLQIEDQATLQERARIAREIHDSLGHLLTAQSIQLENAFVLFKSNLVEAKTYLQDGRRLGADALAELRQAISVLRSDPLRNRTLEAAISDLVNDFIAITGVSPDWEIKLNSSLPTSIQVAIYRIVEEALTNIYKYSHATQVIIKLEMHSETLHLQIEDNGIGFSIEQNRSGFGLHGMRERAESLGGELRITSQLNAGCLITAYFPILGAVMSV
jgi:signal transduction histidine kinase